MESENMVLKLVKKKNTILKEGNVVKFGICCRRPSQHTTLICGFTWFDIFRWI